MVVFVSILVIGFLVLVFSLILGEVAEHAGDMAHDIAVEHEVFDHGGDVDHAQGGPSIFSLRFLSAFVTGFGGGGAIGRYFDLGYMTSSLIGIGVAFVTAGIVYLIVKALFKQQATSGFSVQSYAGKPAIVSVPIIGAGLGQVTLSVKGQTVTYSARSEGGIDIPEGKSVSVKQVIGDCVIVG